MVGSTLQQTCRVEEEKAVRAVENRGDGTKMGGGSAHLEAARRLAAGVDSSAAYDGGAIFGNPRRGIRRRPQALVGGRDGSVGTGDVEA
jgi:hypothetical protein